MDFHQTWYICIDIVEVWFGIDNGQILLICLPHDSDRVLSFPIVVIFTQWVIYNIDVIL